MTPAPDFWDIHSADAALLALPDRLDRHNLPMLYHFSYDLQYHVGLPIVPSATLSREPQARNNSESLGAGLNALWKSMDDDHRIVVPTPSPLLEDSQPSATVKLRRLPGVQGIVAIDAL
jgi:hypothetical protein